MKHFLVHRCFSVLLATLAVACVYRGDSPEPRDPNIFRCKQDGLCTKEIERHSLSGAYRKGNKELKFDILYRPTLTFDEHPWPARFADSNGYTFIDVSAPGKPNEWMHPRWDGADEIYGKQDLEERNEMVMEMFSPLWDMPEEKRATGAWRELWVTADQFNPNGEHAKEMKRLDERVPRSEEERKSMFGEGGNQIIELPFLPKDVRMVIDHPVMLRDIPEWIPNQYEPQERHFNTTKEYRQEIELFQKPVQKYIFFGPETPMQHTAARIYLYSRPIDSPPQTPFRLETSTDTHNHGAGPRNPAMRSYQRCKDLPVTRGYYAWKGECPGHWGREHLCNDDTALQVFNGYGGYNDPAYCHNMFRGFSIECRKPW